MKKLFLSAWIVSIVLAGVCPAQENLVENGDFERGGEGSAPGWRFVENEADQPLRRGVGTDEQSGERFLYIAADRPDTHAGARWLQQVPVHPAHSYELTFRARCEVENPGADRIVSVSTYFIDAEGQGIPDPHHTKRIFIANHQDQWPASVIEDVTDWTTFRHEFIPPPGAREVAVQLSFRVRGNAGRVELANVSLTAETQTVDEVLALFPETLPVYDVDPNPVRFEDIEVSPDWTLDEAASRISQRRSEVSLNAFFAVQPTMLGEAPAEGDWAYSKVPGIVWEKSRGGEGHRYGTGPTAVYGLNSVIWSNINQTPRASDGIWYLRNFPVDDAPSDSHAWRLVFDNLKYYVGRLYLNGRFMANLQPHRNVVDVSSAIRPGETNQLLLYCLPVRSEKKYAHEVWEGNRPRYYDSTPGRVSSGRAADYHMAQAATLEGIRLQRLPAEPAFARVRVIPSWRDKTLTLELPAAEGPRDLSYELTVRSADGRTVIFDGTAPDRATVEGDALRLTYEWPDPRPWSAADPYLYTYTLSARNRAGDLIDETLPERFGFREIWIEGRDLVLNGRPLYLRPAYTLPHHVIPGTENLRRHLAFLKDMGFNTLKLWAEGGLQTMEVRFPVRDLYRLADEMGLYAVVYTPYRMVSGGQFNDETAEASANLLAYVDEHLIQVVENHPSVIAYSGFGKGWKDGINYLQYRPDVWGAAEIDDWTTFTNTFPAYAADHADQAADMKAVLEQSVSFIESVKAMDPTRPFLSHHDIGQGDAWSVYSYFNWTPLQEWEDWPKAWSRHGVMPIGSGEGGLPFLSSFANCGIPDGDLEPWFAEYAAMLMGDEAYRLVSESYLERIRASYEQFAPAFGRKYLSNIYVDDPIYQRAVADIALPRLYRSWRTYGVPLGMEPFGYPAMILPKETLTAHHRTVLANADDPVASGDFYPDRAVGAVHFGFANFTMPNLPIEPTGRRPDGLMPIGVSLHENHSPFLGWIAGPPGNFTARDHVFESGETVRKQIALIWDAHQPRTLRAAWRLERDGTAIDGDDLSVELAPGEHRMIPISFRVETDAAREDLTLALEIRDADGRLIEEDAFALQVYGARDLPFDPGGWTAFALDPRGDAERFLREVGVRSIRSFDTAAAFREAVEALGGDDRALAVIAPGALPLLLSTPAADAALDGPPLLVLEQRADALESLGFRAYPVRQRRAFAFEPGHPVLRDMTPAECRDWRVAPTLLGEGPEPARKGYNYRTGTGGAIASIEIETPATGCFTPLLSCGFDLNSSPLLNLDTGRRRIVFCQLSLTEGIAAEPAARRLAENLIADLIPPRAERERANRFRSTALLGGEADRAFLERLGLSFDKEKEDSAGVIVVAAADASPEHVIERVRDGATAVILPAAIEQRAETWRKLAGTGLRKESLFYQPRDVLDGRPALDHLGQNSLHFRQALPVWTADGAVLNVTETGRGRIVWIGFDPRDLDIDATPWLRLTQRRMVRTIAQVLNNVDADFRPFAASFEDRMAGRGGAALLELPRDSILLAGPEVEAAGGDWRDPDYDDGAWLPFPVDRLYTARNPAYLRVAFELPASWPAGRDAMFDLGTFDDYDEAWMNGERIGGVTPENSTPQTAWSTRRLYRVPASLLQPGRTHVLAIKTWKLNPDQDAIVRGSFRLGSVHSVQSDLYWGTYRISDDPYLQRHW
jgi:beta-galactosidase